MTQKQNISSQLNDLLAGKNFHPEMMDRLGKPSTADQAKTFTFDYQPSSGKNYGTMVIVLDSDNDLKVFYGDNLGRAMEGADKDEFFDFQQQLNRFARMRRWTYTAKDLSKLKHTMQGLAAIKEGLFEGYYGNRHISYSGKPTEARLMIKHSQPLGETDARYRHVESLYIETVDSERFKLPFNNMSGGRAMLEHVRQGGKPYDVRGVHIAEMVTEIAVLSRFNRASARRMFEGSTAQLVEQSQQYYQTLKEQLSRMSHSRGYSAYFESWHPADINAEQELVEDIKQMFVENSLDQRIEQALPVLAKIQQTASSGTVKEADIFESWAQQLVEGTWAVPETAEQQNKLEELLAQPLPVGPDAVNATEALYDLIGDDQLYDQLAELAAQDPDADARDLVLQRLQQLGLKINDGSTPSTSGQQDVAEGSGQEPGWFEIFNLRTRQRVYHPFEADNIMDAEVKADDWLEAIGKSARGFGVRPIDDQQVTEGWKEKVAASAVGAAMLGGGVALDKSGKEWARKNPEQAAAIEKAAQRKTVKPLNFSNNPYSNDTVPDLNDPTNDRMKLKNIDEQGVAEGSEIKIPTEDGITMQDIRLMAGEGKLTKKTVLQAIAVIRKQRREQGVATGSEHQQQDLDDVADWMNTTPDKVSVEVRQEPIEKFIKQIREMYGTYDEFPEDEQRTSRILKLLKRGAQPLPVYVEANDPDLFVMEGRHRMVAFWLVGMKSIPVAYVSIKGQQGVAEGDRPDMKDGRPYSDPLRRHPGNDSYMTPEYLIQKYQDELKKIAAGPYKRPKDVAMYQARIAKLQRQQGVAESGEHGVWVVQYWDKQPDNDPAHREFTSKPAAEKFISTLPKNYVTALRAHGKPSRPDMGESVAEAYQFKGGFPFDVDHMSGAVHRDHDMATDNVRVTNKKDWDRAVNSINARVFDDMAEFRSDSKGERVTGNGAVWAMWDHAKNSGWFNAQGRPVKSRTADEQGVAEGYHLADDWEEVDTINSTQGRELGSVLRHRNGTYAYYDDRKAHVESGFATAQQARQAFVNMFNSRKKSVAEGIFDRFKKKRTEEVRNEPITAEDRAMIKQVFPRTANADMTWSSRSDSGYVLPDSVLVNYGQARINFYKRKGVLNAAVAWHHSESDTTNPRAVPLGQFEMSANSLQDLVKIKDLADGKSGVTEGIMSKIANKVMGAAPEQPKYKVGQRVKYETSPHQPDWADGGSGVGVITDYKNGHYMINGNPVNHFEITGVVTEDSGDLTDIWQQGKEAAYKGKSLTSCPYKMFSREYNAWQQGWQDQKGSDRDGVAEGVDNPLKDIDPNAWHLIRGDVPVAINFPGEYTAKSFHSGHGYGRETKILHGSQVRQNAYLKHNPGVINYPEYSKGVAEGSQPNDIAVYHHTGPSADKKAQAHAMKLGSDYGHFRHDQADKNDNLHVVTQKRYFPAYAKQQGVAEGLTDIVKGIKRKVAGKEDPEQVLQRRYTDTVKANHADKDVSPTEKRYEKVRKVVRKPGVAEAGNKPVEKYSLGWGDTRTARELKAQMRDASDKFVNWAADDVGPFHSRVAKMQGKLAKSELRKRADHDRMATGTNESSLGSHAAGADQARSPDMGDPVYRRNRLVGWFKGFGDNNKVIVEPNEEEMSGDHSDSLQDMYWDRDAVTILPAIRMS